MTKGYMVVEGHGEIGAAPNLVSRLWQDLKLPHIVWDPNPRRSRGLSSREGVATECDRMRLKRDCGFLLFLRDEDDGCPKKLAPIAASWLADAKLPFPSAFVLLHREFETLFLPCLARMAGKPLVDPNGKKRPGIVAGARFRGHDFEAVRDAKGAVSAHFVVGSAYKPSLDQLALTRLVDFETLRKSGLPCFATLERALKVLATATPGQVYPSGR